MSNSLVYNSQKLFPFLLKGLSVIERCASYYSIFDLSIPWCLNVGRSVNFHVLFISLTVLLLWGMEHNSIIYLEKT